MYEAGPIPTEYDASWLDRELKRLEQSLRLQDLAALAETNVAPSKPRKGDIRLADGVNWNPGGGAGFYGFHSGVWNKLG